MNKSLLIIVLTAFVMGNASGQITLGTNDFSHANDTFRVSMASPYPGLAPATTGANMTWDYSQLSNYYLNQTVDTFRSISSLPPLMFLAYTFQKPCNQATYSATSFLNLIGIPVNGTYDCYNNGSSNFRERGIGILYDTLAAPVTFSSDDIIYKFPLAYGNTDSSSSGYVLNQIPGIYYSTSKKRVNTVDGWGTLITPFGTFQTLRVQSVIHQHDSISLDTLGIPLGFDLPEAIEYKWVAAGKGIPLLQINTNGGIPTQIIYRDSNRTVISVPEIAFADFSFEVYPNPSPNTISVKYSLSKPAAVAFEIIAQDGKVVYSEPAMLKPASPQSYVLKQQGTLSGGTYFLRMNVDGKYITRPLVIAR